MGRVRVAYCDAVDWNVKSRIARPESSCESEGTPEFVDVAAT